MLHNKEERIEKQLRSLLYALSKGAKIDYRVRPIAIWFSIRREREWERGRDVSLAQIEPRTLIRLSLKIVSKAAATSLICGFYKHIIVIQFVWDKKKNKTLNSAIVTI